MAPAEINLSQTRRWLAQLHTTNLPPVSAPSSISSSSTSSSSSTHSRGSVDYTSSASSCTICASASCGSGSGGGTCTSSTTTTTTTTTTMTTTMTTVSSSPLTETRARSLQRLCALSDAHRAAEDEVAAPAAAAAAAPSGNERFAPSNINYIRATGGGGGQGPKMDAQSMGWSRWARRQSVQSLGAVERDAAPRFSLSKLKSWW